MSEEDNVLPLTNKTTGLSLTVIADQELQDITVLRGNQLEVKRTKHLSMQEITATTAKLIIANNPDGTWLIDGQGAATAQVGAQLVLKSPIGSGASLHGLVLLLGLVTNQQFLLSQPTLVPTDCRQQSNKVDTFRSPAEAPPVSAHGELTVKQLALTPAEVQLKQLLQAIIQLMEQKLTP